MSDPTGHPAARSRPRLPVRLSGFAGGLFGRNLNPVTLSVTLLFGFGILFAGLEIVRVSPQWGFTYDGAVDGILSQLAVTGPAAVLLTVATAANVLAGAVVLRLLGAPAFRRISDVALAGFAAAVVLDATVLFLLGSLGLFGLPELLALHVAVALAYLATRRRRPLMAAPIRVRISRPALWWPLVVAVWAGPIIVALASPAVPFMDVLPNHVAPVEHVRVFGSFGTLTTSPSPIYGPSRLMLGYVALLGQLTTITGLDAVLAEAAFAVPFTVLIAIAVRRLAGELFGGSASFWALLTFPLTFTFMRIPDSRGTVVVFPLAAWALCTVAAELRARRPAGRGKPAKGDAAGAALPKHSRLPDLSLAFALGAGFLVHPLVGLVALTAAGGALLLYPARLWRRLLPALAGGAVLASPQVLTLGAIAAPSWIGAICVAAGVALAFGLAFLAGALADRLAARAPRTVPRAAGTVPRAAGDARAARAPDGARAPGAGLIGSIRAEDLGRALLVGAVILGSLAVAARLIPPSGDPAHPSDPSSELMVDFPHLVWLSIGGAALSILRLGRGWILLGCGIAAGLLAWAASGYVGYADLTQKAIHYEVPKSIEYWLPAMLAIGGAGALAAVCRQRSLRLLRPALIAVFLVVTVYPTTQPLATNVQIGEHRAAESLGLSLREAERGYWTFNTYPDPRHIIDAPRQEVVDRLRADVTAGRLGPETRVLHIAYDFQQWSSVPIGVFTGALETSISCDPELSIHTEGGRLLGFDRLDVELASDYGYVVLEPYNPRPTPCPGLSAKTTATITSAGYHEIWSNSRAIIYART